MFTVAKPFHTMNRRFKAGDPVAPNDIQGSVSFETWLERGFIAETKKSGGHKPAKAA